MHDDLATYDVVVVPFPFTYRPASTRRPALVVSSARFNQSTGNAVLAMITSEAQSRWLGDVPIRELAEAGLPNECVVRLKLFTLDQRLVIRRAGRLASGDVAALAAAWKPLVFA